MDSFALAKNNALNMLQSKAGTRAIDLVVPKHIGIIMDGNRRWAEKQGLPRAKGHEAGAKALERITEYAARIGVEDLTVYAFSTENWQSRTKIEIQELFGLIILVLKRWLKKMQENGVGLSLIGNVQKFPLNLRRVLFRAKEVLKKNNRIKLNLALNYGGRDEILRAFQEITERKVSAKEINEELLSKHLDTRGMPEPNLIIRTGGRQWLSNFLVWQCTYSELYFTDALWPNFGPEELDKAILYYSQCERNFGK